MHYSSYSLSLKLIFHWICSEAHPASYLVITVGCFFDDKTAGTVKLPSFIVEVKNGCSCPTASVFMAWSTMAHRDNCTFNNW